MNKAQAGQKEMFTKEQMDAEKERYKNATRMYLLDVLGYIDPKAKDRLKMTKISCSELCEIIKKAIILRNADMQALVRANGTLNDRFMVQAQRNLPWFGEKVKHQR